MAHEAIIRRTAHSSRARGQRDLTSGGLSPIAVVIAIALLVAAVGIAALVATRPDPILMPSPEVAAPTADPASPGQAAPSAHEDDSRSTQRGASPAFMRDTGEIGPVEPVPASRRSGATATADDAPASVHTPMVEVRTVVPQNALIITASKDGYVRAGPHSEMTFGGAESMVVKGSDDLEFQREMYLQFEVEALRAGFASVDLVLVPTRTNEDVARTVLELALLVDAAPDWSEAELSAVNRPNGTPGPAITFRGDVATGQPCVVDVTPLMRAHLAATPDQPCTFRMRGLEEVPKGGMHFASRENEDQPGPRLCVVSAASFHIDEAGATPTTTAPAAPQAMGEGTIAPAAPAP